MKIQGRNHGIFIGKAAAPIGVHNLPPPQLGWAALPAVPLITPLKFIHGIARMYLQLSLRQWGAGNLYLLVLSSWKVNIAKNPIAIMGL